MIGNFYTFAIRSAIFFHSGFSQVFQLGVTNARRVIKSFFCATYIWRTTILQRKNAVADAY